MTTQIAILYTKDKKVCEKYNLEENQIVFVKKSGLKSYYKNHEDTLGLVNFLKFAKYDFLGNFDVETVGELIGDKMPMLVYFNKNPDRKHLKILEQIYQKI